MSKRAEKRGLQALPPRWRKTKDGKGKIDSSLPVRKFYIRAYEQAEKDTIERAIAWLKDYVKYFEIYDEKGIEEFKKAMEEEI